MSLKKQIILIAIVIFTTACTDEMEPASSHVHHNEIEEISEFVLPDTLDVKKELVIAAYYEIHPVKACVIIAYNDTSRTLVKRYSYFGDSSFVVKELLKVGYNEFKVMDEPGVSYTIKPTSVVWSLQSGNMASSAEFDRIDQMK